MARLLAVRRVKLQAAGRRLRTATQVVTQLQTTTARIVRLRDDIGLPVRLLTGYEAKAVTAARAMLGAANARQHGRIVEAQKRRRAAAAAVSVDHAATDAVERAIRRARDAAPARQDIKP